jgi:hypothetical protein
MAWETLWLTSDGAGAVVYSAADWRRSIYNMWTTGVLNGCAVSQNGSPNMTVQVAAGDAVIPSATNEGRYLAWETAATTGVTIGAAPVTVGQSRNDLVCLFTKDPAASGGTAGRVTSVVVVAGTAATTGAQVDPSTPAFHLVLARVTVANGTAAITNAMITDLRSFATLNGEYVATANLNASAVTTAKIADDAVTAAKIAFSAVGSNELAAGAVLEVNIANDAVTAQKIVAGAVGTTELATGAVTTAKYAFASVDGAAMGAGAVNTVNIVDDAVTSAKVADAEATTASGVTLRRLGNIVIARGNFAGATIPAGWRPVAEVRVPCNTANDGSSGYLVVNASTGACTYTVHTGETDGGVAYASIPWTTS